MHKIVDFRFIFTPFTMTKWTHKGVKRTYIYIFGIKIIDLAI